MLTQPAITSQLIGSMRLLKSEYS